MPNRVLMILLACIACGLSSSVGSADTTIIGGETRVIDGDTLEVKGERVRLHGIDAPEKGQLCENVAGERYSCGQEVIRALRQRIGENNISCAIDAQRDRYGRALGVCAVHGEDLNAWLVSQGHALAYRRYSLKYVGQEEAARAGARGLWAGDFVPPWDWRRGKRLQSLSTATDAPGDEFDALALYDDNGNGRITCKEARGHGIAPVPHDHPAYPYMDDRDGDGVVCE